MIGRNNIIGIIPARSGSKRLKNKNIFKIKNKPLIVYTFEAAKKSKYIDNLILSTDSKKIINIATKYQIKYHKIRPKKLSEDKTPTIDVLKYELKNYKLNKLIVVLLQPTSPLRLTSEIDKSLEIFFNKKLNSLVSITKYKTIPKFPIQKDKHNKIKNFLRPSKKTNYFGLNGSIFIFRANFLYKYNKLYRKGTYCFETNYSSSIDVDNIDDIKQVKKLI